MHHWRRNRIILGKNNDNLNPFLPLTVLGRELHWRRTCNNRGRNLLRQTLHGQRTLLPRECLCWCWWRWVTTSTSWLRTEFIAPFEDCSPTWLLVRRFLVLHECDAEVLSFSGKHFIDSFESHDKIVFHKEGKNPIKTFLKAYKSVGTKRSFHHERGRNFCVGSDPGFLRNTIKI